MKSSDTLSALMPALVAAQGSIKNITKEKKNTHFKNNYADIADGLDVIRPALSANGLAVTQSTDFDQDRGIFTLHTRIYHISGEWIGSTYPLPTNGKAQDMGSAITYARRYALFALVGVAATDEDNDGNDAAEVKMPHNPAFLVGAPSPKLSSEARSAALGGTVALRAFWDNLIPAERVALASQLGGLKQIAKEEDSIATTQ
jgi:hypothetical protein